MRHTNVKTGFLIILLIGSLSCGGVASSQASRTNPLLVLSTKNSSQLNKLKTSRDAYYKTEGVVSGPRAPRLKESHYPRVFGESRVVIWAIAQQHLYWAGFVLGSLFLVTMLEIIALCKGHSEVGKRYDSIAQEIFRLLLMAISIAAILGGLFFISLLTLYPVFTSYLVSVFRSTFLIYGVLVFVFTLLAYLYYYTWLVIRSRFAKLCHASLGILTNVVGILLTFLGNAWSSFMMSPAGVDERGQFLGNVWHTIHTALWNPLNVHRLASHIMLGAGVVAAYGAYHVLTASTQDERARYDWMAYRAFVFLVFAFFTMPFGGYWLLIQIYRYNAQMAITLLGGLLAWLGVVLATLIGLFFFALNYYLWQRIDAADGMSRYGRYAKYVFGILVLSMMVCVTPHTMVTTPLELLQMSGQQHPVLGNYGVEAAKLPAMNIMIVMTLCSWAIWHRCRSSVSTQAIARQDTFLLAAFFMGATNIVALGIYGFFVPANVRMGLNVAMFVTPLSLLIFSLILRPSSTMQPHKCVLWGTLSFRGYGALIFLAFIITWIMGLGGYRRSSVRSYWHINEIMRDASSWAYTHSIGFAANMISLNALLFWAGILLVFWLAKTHQPTIEDNSLEISLFQKTAIPISDALVQQRFTGKE